MEKKHQVHNLIILDESGSMSSIQNSIIRGFNELVQSIKGIEQQFPEQEHFISFISFNNLGNKVLHFMDPVSQLNEINSKTYTPNACTPLYDAIGFSINKLKHTLKEQTDYNVLVTIMTDGEENASREYSGISVKALIDELKKNNWTFTYIGTDHDIEKAASSLSIDHTMAFEKNEQHIKAMFLKDRVARSKFSQSLKDNNHFSDKYFD